jgi:chromosome segregation ATPase
MKDEAKKDLSQDEQIEQAQKEYDEEFERLASEEAKAQNEDEDKEPEKDGESEAKTKEEQEGQEEQEAIEASLSEEQKSKDHGSIESLEKALNDTKSYATKLAEEKAELVKKLKEYEEGKATQKEVEDQKKATEDAKDDLDKIKESIYEDYPELKAILDPLLEQSKVLKKTVEEIRAGQEKKAAEDTAEAARKAAFDEFNKNVKPKILEKHADFDRIVRSEAYWKWADEQRPALKFAAMDSPDPEDIVMAVTEFKKSAYADKIEGFKSKQAEKKQQILTSAQTLRGGSTSFPSSGKKSVDPNDYEAGWKEAEEKLKSEGIRA